MVLELFCFMPILQVIPGSDITYGVDPPPLVAEPKGKKKSKEKKQKK